MGHIRDVLKKSRIYTNLTHFVPKWIYFLSIQNPARGQWGRQPAASPLVAAEPDGDGHGEPDEGRSKWSSPVSGTGQLAVQDDEETSETARSQWGDGGNKLRLSNVALEQTASGMEGQCNPGISDLGTVWFRLGPIGKNPGLFQIRFSAFWPIFRLWTNSL